MKERQQNVITSEKLPLSKSLLWIALSVLLITGSASLGILYYSMVSNTHKHDNAYNIVAIVQTSPEVQGFRTGYLAELFNLSVDHPTNLYTFDAKWATEMLKSCPVVKEATVRKIRPGTIHVDYTLCKPIAYLADYSNTAIDNRGVAFPFHPFFTPKNLPEIYLGISDDSANGIWGKPIKGKSIDLAFAILNFSQETCCNESSSLVRIDLSKAFASSYGQRQIVLEFQDTIQKISNGAPVVITYMRILRLAPENYQHQLVNYVVLRDHLQKKEKLALVTQEKAASANSARPKTTIIDLRLSELAFISSE